MRVIQIGFVLALAFFAFTNNGPKVADPTAPMTPAELTFATALVQESTVRVAARSCDGVIRGSGFGANGHLFTNKHLTLGSDEIKVDQLGTPVLRPVLRRAESLDIALAGGITVRELVLSADGVVPGAPLILGGHAGGGALAVISGTAQLEVDGAAYGIEGRVLLIDATTSGGFSGGPVLNRHGEVVAMLQGFDPVTGLTLAIPAKSLSNWANSTGTIGTGVCA